MKTICFTGRRPKNLCGYDHDSYVSFVKELRDILTGFQKDGYDRFISGGAQGFDQLAFWAIYGMDNVENIVYVPFKGQERIWAENGLFSQHEYRLMLKKATKVKYLQNTLYDNHQIYKALYDRNHRMVDDSDMVIALYPDYSWMKETGNASGGTAECMRYAQTKGKNILQLCYETKKNELRITETRAY